MTKKVAKAMIPGTHGSTFGGNPLAMAVGNAVLDQIDKNLLMNVNKMSKYFINELNKIKIKYPKIIKDVRGVGLLIGLQLFKDQTEFIKKLMENKLLTIRAAENVIRILPPLNVKKREIDIALKIISKVCNEIKIKYPKVIKEVRGVGLLIGLQLFKDQTKFIKKLMENKLLTIRAAENVIRILPPLNVKKREIDIALKTISKVCNQIK